MNRLPITILTAILFMLNPSAEAQSTRPSREPNWPAIDPNLPTLWLIGDSTVRNGRDNGNNGQWGWGNPIAHYFDHTKINVRNRAVGGMSSRTYRTHPEMWPTVLPLIKPGDFLILQFGHNDGGAINDNSRARGTLRGNGEETEEIDNMLTGRREVVHTFGWYIRQYITEAKQKGASVIVCSPIPRNRWSDGKIGRDSRAPIAKEAAEQAGAAFIDLNQMVIDRYHELGQQKVTDELFPENEYTHPSWAGAVLNAELVVRGIQSLADNPLKDFLLPEPPRDLKHPTGRAR